MSSGSSPGPFGESSTKRSISPSAGGAPTIAAALFLTAVSTSLVPSAGTVAVLCVLFCTQGVAMGALDTIANVIIIYLWGDGAGPWMQGLHAAFAVGAVVSPLVVRLSPPRPQPR